jgi:hypothetical protein
VPAHDNGQLFSGLDFAANALGYAGVGSMCTPSEFSFMIVVVSTLLIPFFSIAGSTGGIDQTDSNSDAFNAAIVAHEMGVKQHISTHPLDDFSLPFVSLFVLLLFRNYPPPLS